MKLLNKKSKERIKISQVKEHVWFKDINWKLKKTALGKLLPSDAERKR